jgi:protein-disulfide isomerase
MRGAADALVTIVEFSDFQCPFCGRAEPTMKKLLDDYPGQVRLYFKHDPLPFHQDAPLASQAALAASAQGKFWEMHDKLFANQTALKRPELEKYAQELGLDMAKFKQALDTNAYKGRIDADTALAGRVGVTGTPAFFLNGRLISGAMPYATFKTMVDEEIATAKKLIASGTPKNKVYDKLMEGAGTGPTAAAAAPRPAVPTDVYKVPVGDGPTKGGSQPKVTVIEFSDFQCPFCSRVEPTLKQVLSTYGNDVKVVWKNLPLPMHPNAPIAAEAAEAAREQGKFWEMHEVMFKNQGALGRPELEKYAQELGLDMAKFKAALDGGKGKERIEADKKLASQFGIQGTPSFFVNGRKFVGAQPFDAFKALIDEEMKKADAKLSAGTPRGELYAAVTKDGLEKAAAPPPRPSAPGAGPGTIYKVDASGPAKGPKDALITIVQFSDFQCPFCSRVEPTVNKIMDEYKDKVRVVWRDYPLPFHPNAMPAAALAREAGAEGKFWKAHELLFKNQQALGREDLDKYAKELGLKPAKVKAAIDDKKYEAAIKADMEAGQKIGVNGTPAFFINGVSLSGAQPYEAFKSRIDEELKKAEALVKKGTPKAKVYDEIMKTAGSAPAAAPAAAGAGDETVHKVIAGSAPARGPKNAPVTVVLFSDFQCPFCKRVEPTIEQLEKEYPGKIRVVWKDFPLEFHPNAKPAAMAARAAAEEGKFWEMHKKLFDGQPALDRPTLEKYAQDLGLNMSKFKAALDGNRFSSGIESDMKEGQTAGVSGTPAAFINGRLLSGAQPIDAFKRVVDQELAKSRKGS